MDLPGETRLGEVVAERRLEWAGGGPEHGVVVRIGRPVPDPEPGGDWLCWVQIVGMHGDAVRAAYGVDAVQALVLALWMIDVDLRALQRDVGGTLLWLDQTDLGFLLRPPPD
ncbi:MAG: hypothetical protein AB1941_01780 [Gemmatimonadota bacterium]